MLTNWLRLVLLPQVRGSIWISVVPLQVAKLVRVQLGADRSAPTLVL